MGKRYSTTLILQEGDERLFNRLANSYRKAYNAGVEVQFKYLSYHRQLLQKDTVYNQVLEARDKLYLRKVSNGTTEIKVDDGIIESAVSESVKYFHKWWKDRLTKNSESPEVPYIPRHLLIKQGAFFKTSTILRISSKSYLYIPKLGERRLKKLKSVPSGAFKNAKFEFNGKKWVIYLESTSAIQPITEFLRESLEVLISDTGTMYIEDSVFKVPTKEDSYKTLERKLRKVKEEYQETSIENNGKRGQLENKIKHLKSRINGVKTSYYSRIAAQIVACKPRIVLLRVEHNLTLFKEAGINYFLNNLKRRAKEVGIKVIEEETSSKI
jgi:hypothetical protein